jgi:hypothetical protein
VKEARSLAQYSLCLRDLEEAFRWRDEKDDNRESALVTSWRASRPNWLKTVNALGDEAVLARVLATIPAPAEAIRATVWTRAANEQLVAYLDKEISMNARRLRSLTFVDVAEPRAADLATWPTLRGIPLAQLRSRFAILKMVNQLIAAIVVPVAPLWTMEERSLGTLLRNCKKLLFLEVISWLSLERFVIAFPRRNWRF